MRYGCQGLSLRYGQKKPPLRRFLLCVMVSRSAQARASVIGLLLLNSFLQLLVPVLPACGALALRARYQSLDLLGQLVACGIGISGNHNHGPLPLFVFQRRT